MPAGLERAVCLALQHPDDLRRTSPETFEVVEFPFFGRKDVNDYVAEVQQNPAGGGGAFPAVPGELRRPSAPGSGLHPAPVSAARTPLT